MSRDQLPAQLGGALAHSSTTRLGGAAVAGVGVAMLVVPGAPALLGPYGAVACTLIVLGTARLLIRTAGERMRQNIAELDEEQPDWARSWAELREAPLPFSVCTRCKTETEGRVFCGRCATGAWVSEIETESDRTLAAAAIES